ncbi:MAG: hypothetical protein WD669_02235 [Pirellulales bacterium]
MQLSTDRFGLKWVLCLASTLAAAGLSITWPSDAWSQGVVLSEGQPQPESSGSGPRGRRGGARGAAAANEAQATPQAQGEAAKPNQPGAEKKEGQPTAGEKKDEKPADVQRPEAPPREADPKELDVLLNEQGLVPQFNFQGQPWPAVLQWYAKLANCSLDWTELPNGYVNVFTQRPYALDDVRSLLNRYLLARGFTLLQRDRVVSIFKMENLDPSLVEHVSEIELFLSSRKPYDIAKVAFAMPKNMDIAKAKDDLKQVLNPKAKVMPFVSTRQVLVIDAVANLQTLSQLINEERAKDEGKSPLKHIVLKHRRAEDVIDILYVTLGMDPKSKPSQQELQVRQQELQIMQQMAQKGTDVTKMLKPDGPPVFLTFNSQMNSIIANAPEEQMKMIEETIRWLDVPLGGASGTAAPATVADNTRTMTTYKLRTLNPQTFKKTLEDIGELNPFTVIEADVAGRALFVQAIAADHKTIAGLIEKLDGEEREIRMIQLSRRYSAEEVATSIQELVMGKKAPKEENSQDVYYRALASMYSSSSRGSMPKEDPHEGFYVSPDVVNNRLLVKANTSEFEQITNLLKTMGEVQLERKDGIAMRVLEPTEGDVLERLRKAWTEMGENPLIIDVPEKKSTDSSPDADEKKDEAKAKKASSGAPAKDRGVHAPAPSGTPAVLAQFASTGATADETGTTPQAAEQATGTSQETAVTTLAKPADDAAAEKQSDTAASKQPGPPPVSITVTEDGRMLLRSSDPEALERLETLINELSPPAKRFKVFPLKHSSALNMWWNLNDVYKEELKEDTQTIMDIYGRYQRTPKEGGTGLARRPKLMITYDPPTNSILVANASTAQLHEIGQLIEDFDKPTPTGLVRARVNATVKIHYSRASIIAAALKEVYVDLLSSNDKEFASAEGRRQTRDTKTLTTIKFGDSTTSATVDPPQVRTSFNGELSIGIDDVSNTLLISCQEELFDGVVNQIRRLDEESAPKMQIVVQPLSGSIKASDLQKTMSDSVGRAWLGGRPEDQIAARGGPSGQPNANPDQNNPPPGNRGGGAARPR